MLFLYYIIEFLKDLRIKDYLFFTFLFLPVIFIYLFSSNIDTIKLATDKYSASSYISLTDDIYIKNKDYYFKTPPIEACNLFSEYIVSFSNYKKDVDQYKCFQRLKWEKYNIDIEYIAIGYVDKISSATFKIPKNGVNLKLTYDLVLKILETNFKINNPSQYFNSYNDISFSIMDYEISLIGDENSITFKIK